MALAAVPNGAVVKSPQETREAEILDRLYALHSDPESGALLSELDDLIGELVMIEGSRYQHQESEPPYVETPGDEFRLGHVGLGGN
jgi:hypothetical protein